MPNLNDFKAIPDFRGEGMGFTGTCPACNAATLSLKIAVWGQGKQALDYWCSKSCQPAAIDVALAKLNRPAEPVKEAMPPPPAGKTPAPAKAGGSTAAPVAEPGVPRMHAKLLTRAQLRAMPEPIWQVEHLFFEKSFIEVFGPPNQGKTFLATDIAMAITMGGHWQGRDILMPGPAFYINADGGAGFSKRANAWAAANGDPVTTFEFWTYPDAIQLHNFAEMAELRALLAYLPERPAIIVIDTYSQCLAGGNENLQEVASLVIQQINEIRNVIGCSVMLLHHANAMGNRDRGSTVIAAAADTVIRVDQEEEGSRIIQATCRKQRDSDWFKPMNFRIEKYGEDKEFAWIVPTVNEFTKDKADHENTERVVAYIRMNPGHSAMDIAQRTAVDKSEVKLIVNQLLIDGEVEEDFVPGRSGRGLHWAGAN